MLNYLQYLDQHIGIPQRIFILIIVFFAVSQIIGEIIELGGRVAPGFLKIRRIIKNRIDAKKKERETIASMTDLLPQLQDIPATLKEVNALLANVGEHYSEDNITKRDKWMQWVNDRASVYDESIVALNQKMDKNNATTLSLYIKSMKSDVLDFASKVIDEKYPVTREQFNRIFKTYKEYEEVLAENQMTNGEVDIAIRIIRESYENHMRHHSFVEDIRGYNI